MKITRRYLRPVASFLMLTLLFQVILPTSAYAVTGHNSMPEYRSFEPVSTTNMVNTTDGSFTYNIPVLNIPNGYPISLSYHSGEVNPEGLASWVGFGWTLNPGAINRTKRGIPDDFNGNSITYHNKMPANWTVSAGGSLQPELFGWEGLIGISGSLRYNNYKGLGMDYNLSLSAPGGIASLHLNYSAGKFGFSPQINPGKLFRDIMRKSNKSDAKQGGTRDSDTHGNTKEERKKAREAEERKKEAIRESQLLRLVETKKVNKPSFSFSVGDFSFGSGSSFSYKPTRPEELPTNVTPYDAFSLSLKVDVGIDFLPLPIDGEVSVFGNFNTQKNEEKSILDSYGYLYSENALNNPGSMMDYTTENEKMYEKRDKHLGAPVPNNDIYGLTGEAMGGSFRAYRQEWGTYRKNHAKSETFTINAGADISPPSIVSVIPFIVPNLVGTYGGNLGGGYHFLEVGAWDDPGDAANFVFKEKSKFPNSNENYFFRFNNDMGGKFDLPDNSDDPFQAELDVDPILPFSAELTIPSTWYSGSGPLNNNSVDVRNQRSSYVGHHLNSDFGSLFTSSGVKYKVYEKNTHIVNSGGSVVPYDHTAYPANGIGEFYTNNGDGVTYVYGLPVYSRNEKNLQHSLEQGQYTLSSHSMIANPTAAGAIFSDSKRFLGNESPTPYATQYLITQILGPDYIDRTFDGPTMDDFGSYTRFNYKQEAGGSSWYQFRSPFSGMDFNFGMITEKKDDMGSYSSGERELYYIHSISSKTHTAIFTTEDREDGVGVDYQGAPSDEDLIIGNQGSNGKRLQLLRKIDLYHNYDVQEVAAGIFEPISGAVPIQTVHFDYDYSLCPGVPNNVSSGGKLTLKKVWFEYEGKLASKIAPYQFEYSYPAITYPSPYSGLSMGTIPGQNPAYNVLNSDRWGSYRNFDLLESAHLGDLARFFPFVYQDRAYYDAIDPAAWCLKRIKLPTGGEIHIQYEPNDYHYVQDKQANVMVPLHPATTLSEQIDNKKYYLDLSKLGLQSYFDGLTAAERVQFTHELFKPMKVEKKRMFFNFLYAIMDPPASITSSASDFFEGFARINNYGYERVGANYLPFFVFKGSPTVNTTTDNLLQPIDYGAAYTKREIPKKVCQDYYMNNLQGKLVVGTNALEDGSGEPAGTGEQLLNGLLAALNLLTSTPIGICKEIDPELSMVRVQSPVSKKGGGVRVKRLMMFDDGVPTSTTASLYGVEYDYTTTSEGGKVISSGVATNEPGVGRRENVLVNPIDKEEQSKFEAFLFGLDMYDEEGPMLESMLPAASIAYSKVTVKGIYPHENGTGSEVHEYYTCKDFPVTVRYTPIEEALKYKLEVGAAVGGVGAEVALHFPYMTQGFAVYQNSMHGKLKRVSKYSSGASPVLMAEEYYEYFAPGEKLKLMDEDLVVEADVVDLGTEVERLSEMNKVEDLSVGGGFGMDFTAGAFGILVPPFFYFFPIPVFYLSGVDVDLNFEHQVLRTHVTTTVYSYPAVLKKVENFADDVRHITENLIFDKYTGQPVQTLSYDDYNKTYLNHDFMASWHHKNMRPRAINQDVVAASVIKTADTKHYLDFSSAPEPCTQLDKFVRGDYIEVRIGTSPNKSLYHVDKVDYGANRVYLQKSALNTYTHADGSGVNIFVIRSGYTNQVNAKQGDLVAYDQTTALSLGSTVNPNLTAFLSLIKTRALAGGSILPGDYPDGISAVNPLTGNCEDLRINFTNTGSQIIMNVGAGAGPGMPIEEELCGWGPANPHPAVGHLNNFLDAMWAATVATPASGTVPVTAATGGPALYNYKTYSALPTEVQNVYNTYFGAGSPTFPCIGAPQTNCAAMGYTLTAGMHALSINFGSTPVSFNASSSSATAPWKFFGPFSISNDCAEVGSGIHYDGTSSTHQIIFETSDAADPGHTEYNVPTAGRSEITTRDNYTTEIGKFVHTAANTLGYFSYETGATTDFCTLLMCNASTTTQENGYLCQSIVDFTTTPPGPIPPTFRGGWGWDPATGNVYYTENPNECKGFTCLQLCVSPVETPGSKVVAATSTRYDDHWDYDETIYFPETALAYDDYEKGTLGKWRPKSNYVYRKPSINKILTHNTDEVGYSRFTLFDWLHGDSPAELWVLGSETERYTPNGQAVEDKNILNVYSTGKYGYLFTQPVCVAQNAEENTVAFEGFEYNYFWGGDQYWDGRIEYFPSQGEVVTDYAHTGTRSIEMVPDADCPVGRILVNSQVADEGLMVRGWFRVDPTKEPLDGNLFVTWMGHEIPMEKISSAGEWSLYEAVIGDDDWTSSSPGYTLGSLIAALGSSPTFNIKLKGAYYRAGDVHMDDVRMQPQYSEMVCYVYDKAQRILASFDDQHFGLMYEYNSEGALVRKLKETAEGVKTVSETQYNVKGETR